MKLNKETINAIIRNNSRFLSAYSEPEPYFIYNIKKYTEDFDEEVINLYYKKLRYAVDNSERLVNEMFRDEFYDFYGIDRNVVSSPEQMRSELIFDSFTMDVNDKSVGVYFSNERFMFGHFIDVCWDADWNFLWCWID